MGTYNEEYDKIRRGSYGRRGRKRDMKSRRITQRPAQEGREMGGQVEEGAKCVGRVFGDVWPRQGQRWDVRAGANDGC
jgi:hypothetical protein